VIRIRGLRKWFDSRRGRVEALRGIDLEVAEKEFCVLLGPERLWENHHASEALPVWRDPDAGELEIAGSIVSSPAKGIHIPDREARHRHGFSVLRNLAAHERVSECIVPADQREERKSPKSKLLTKFVRR
jgi:ABC-type polar amino acid transport system ATPase subunit